MSRRPGLLLLLFLFSLSALPALAPAAPPVAPKPTSPPALSRGKPPLDFSGVWELDAAASRGAPPNMLGAVLSVTQSGDRIRIEPVQGEQLRLSADQIVADGRTYEKSVGMDRKGFLTAAWSPDRGSLRIQVTAGPPDNPGASVQRSVWRLSQDRQIWVRQTLTIRDGRSSETLLVFRRRKVGTTPSPATQTRSPTTGS